MVAIHQPPYLPWIGLLDKIARADVFVVLDDVQFNKRAFQHRTLYSTPSQARYLSLSVRAKGHQEEGLRIRNIELDGNGNAPTHYETLRHRYGKTPGWGAIGQKLAEILTAPPRLLVDINMSLLLLTLDVFDIRPKIILSSELAGEGRKSDLMLSLTREAGGDIYLSGSGADSYMASDVFEQAGVGILRQSHVHPVWQQGIGSAFIPGCFALEWFLLEPRTAQRDFHAHIRATGTSLPRSLGSKDSGSLA